MPDNTPYYHAAYAVAILVYSAYLLSLWWRLKKVSARRRNVRERV